MRNTAKKTIGGYEYTTVQLGALEGRRMLIRLLRTAGPAMAALAAEQGNLAGALAKLAADLTDEDVTYLGDTFGEICSVQLDAKRAPQVKDVFDMHFAGDYLSLVQWLAWNLEVNFASFFGGLARARKTAPPGGPGATA